MRTLRGSSDYTETILRATAVALAALLPIFFLPLSWIAVPQAKLLLIAIAVLVAGITWAIDFYRSGEPRTKHSLIMLALLSLPLAYTISALFSGAGPTAFVSGAGEQDTATSMWVLYALALIPFLAFDSFETAASSLMRPFIAAFGAVLLIQIVHLIVPALTLGILNTPAANIFGSWHDLGIACGFVLLGGVALISRQENSSLWNAAIASVAALSALFLLIVNMQDIWFATAAALVVYAILEFFRARKPRVGPTRAFAAGLIGLVCFAAGFGSTFMYGHMPGALKVAAIDVRPSWSTTFMINTHQFDDVRSALVGSGPHTFDRLWALYKPAGINTTQYWNAPFNSGAGFIPTAFATVGVVGILAWIAVILTILYGVLKLIRGLGTNRESYFVPFTIISLLYLIAIHIVSVPSIGVSTLLFVSCGLLALALAEPVRYETRTRSNLRSSAVQVGVVAVAITLFISAFYAIRADISDMFVGRASAQFEKGALDAAAANLRTSLALYPQNDKAERTAVTVGIAQLQRLAAEHTETSAEQLQSIVSKTIAHALSAIAIGKSEYENWIVVGYLYGQLGIAGVPDAYEHAQSAYEHAHASDPNNPIPLLSLASVAYSKHATSTALGYVNQAISLKPDLAAAYSARAQIESDSGDFPTAERDALNAVKLSQNDGTAWITLGMVYYAEGSYQNAIQALGNAQTLIGQNPALSYYLGLSYGQLGNTSAALELLEKVALVKPTDMDLQHIIENLRAGRGMATSAASTTPASSKK